MSTGVRLARGFKPRFSVGVIARLLAVAALALTGQSAWGAAIEGLEVVSNPPHPDDWYGAGDEIRIRATFDEVVRVRHSPRLRMRINVGGTQRNAALSDDRPARQLTFVYRVQDGDNDADGIQVDMGAFFGGSFVDQDDETNVNVATTTLARLPDHKVDAVAPTVAAAPVVVSDPGVDNTYAIGDIIEIEVDFDEEIRVSGDPELILSIGRTGATPPTGPLSRRATLSRVRPTRLVFRYEVQAGDGEDTDGIEIGADALTGGVIEDLRGNPARRALAVTNLGHEVDAVEPSVVGVEIASSPASGNVYGLGEVIEVQLTFDQVVFISSVPRPAGQPPRLALDIGSEQRYADYVTGSGTHTITFRYTVAAVDQDDDGISIGPDALDDGTIEDRVGNEYIRRIDPVREQPNHRVNGNTTNPTATGVAFVTSGGNDGYRIGENIVLTVSFNVPVFVREPREPDEDTELRLILEIGGNSRYAAYIEGTGTETLRFRYMVQSGDHDTDGISIRGGDALVGASIEDEDGTVVGRGLPVVRPDPRQTVDAQRPAADGPPQVESNSGSNGYGLGERIIISVTLTEPVHVTAAGDDTLALLLAIGDRTRRASFVAGSGTNQLEFHYTVRRDDSDSDGFTIGPDALVGGIIQDNAGNLWGQAERRLVPLPANGRNRVDGGRADDAAPFVRENGVEITSTPESRNEYGFGEVIEIEITFSETVYTPGSPPVLEIAIGGNLRNATLAEGSGSTSNTLTFRYVVQDADEGRGVSIGPGELSLLGGTIVDRAGNEALRDFEPLRASSQHRVDGVAPEVEGPPELVGDRRANDPYRLGERIEVEIDYSEPVYVTGTLQLVISIGEHSRRATFVDGSGSSTLKFRYIVQRGDRDDDGISIGPDALVGGTIEDSAGNDWGETQRRLPPLERQPGHTVNATGGTAVVRIEGIDISPDRVTSGACATYGAGENIDIDVLFNGEVHVTGALSLTVLIGSTQRQASLLDGSGTRTLTFRYTVQAGDYDRDGISIGAGPGALVGGTIQSGGTNVDRSFEALAADCAHRVDAVRPTVENVEITSTAENDADYGAGEDIEVKIRFSREVHVTGTPSLTLLIGSTPRQASYVDGSGTDTLTFRYTVQAGDYDDDGISIGAGPGALVGGTIRDGSGADVNRSFEALPAEGNPRVDAVNPTVQSVSISSTPATASTYVEGERIEVVVQFDDDVRIVSDDNLALRLTIGEHTRDAAPTRSAGTTTRSITFRYTVRRGDVDTDGISIAGDALRGGLEDRVGDPVDGRLDPLPNQSGHLVGAEVALGVELNLMVNGPPGVFNLFEEILVPQGIRHYTGTYLPPVSENPSVATARVSGHRLVITPHAEGTSAIVVAAEGAAITLLFAVTVQANQAEVAVLEHALAAMGRGILSSAAHTIGARLETKKRDPLARYGQRIRVLPDPALGSTPQSMGVVHGHVFDAGWQTNAGDVFGADHSPWQGPGQRTPRQGTFEMPLIGGVSRDTAWALWGAGDFSAFEGEPESARFEGDLTAAYVGVDARGEGWLAGAAVGRVDGDADYQFTVDERTSKGNLETTLTVVNPYVQWSLGERGRMWAMVGVGNGEVSIKREDRASPAKPTDLTMRMGMAGLRTEIATAGNFRFALRGDVGSVQLETDDGETALHGLAVNVQRARAGVETSFPLVSPDGGELTPFVDIGARYDAGDGQTGTGAEVAVGMRASGGALRFEAKARTLVMQGEEDYSETGASATVIVEPGSNGKGLRLSLSPRWGGADDSMDVFWQRDRGNGLQAFKREMERGWGVAGRVDYGMAVNGRRGDAATVRPFGEVDVVDDDNQRLRVGMAYELESDAERPLKFEISSERVERDVGTEQRYLLSAEGRF